MNDYELEMKRYYLEGYGPELNEFWDECEEDAYEENDRIH